MTDGPVRGPSYHILLALLCAAVFISYIDRTNISVSAIAMRLQFGWNETQKGVVLSSFYVGYISLMLASGALTNRFGGRIVLGAAVIWWSLFTVLTPVAASISLPLLVSVRIALGLGEAAVFPASLNMIGRLVPVSQRSRAVALIASSLYAGTVFALPVTGWLVQSYGWPVPFYLFGGVGFLWAMAWFARTEAGTNIEKPVSAEPMPIPWRKLLKLPAVWAIVVAHFCSNWPLYLMGAWLPSYFARTFGVSVMNAGLLSAAPSLSSFVMANVAGYFADQFLKAGRSTAYVRKLMQTVGLCAGAVFLLLLSNAASVQVGLILICCAAGSFAITCSGFAPNGLDIAPRHADVIWGISNTFATLPGIFGVFLTGWLVDHTGSFAAPFFVTAGVAFVGALVFLLLASGERKIE
jgi:ACS family sodium-dependent inorganic phosphate cotransporter